MTRSIIHVDLDAFYPSVEEILDPTIEGKPILVGGSPEGRGVVSSASYAARAYGVRSAMPMATALRLCPHAIVIGGKHRTYSEYSKRVMEILSDYTPLWEPISIDEAFLDVTGCELLWGTAPHIGKQLQDRIKAEVGLTASVGIASNKLIAKIASGLEKPAGFVVVPPGTEASFLAPLPVERLWGVGEVTADALKEIGISTIGELASMPLDYLCSRFGRHGRLLHDHSRGIDRSRVHREHDPKSVGHERTFSRDTDDLKRVKRCLLGLCEKTATRLRKHDLQARIVTLKLRYSDFRTVTRRATLADATDLGEVLYEQACDLLQRELRGSDKVRLIGVSASGFRDGGYQLSLFGSNDGKLKQLSRAVDDIRGRFGDKAIFRAALLGRSRKVDEDDSDQ